MYNPPDYYRKKSKWSKAEDKALISAFGLMVIEEICEAYMCTPSCVIQRARQLCILPAEHDETTAKEVELIISLFDEGISVEDVCDKFYMPDYKRRALQDYYARNNENQLDMFDTETNA